MSTVKLIRGDCLEALDTLEPGIVNLTLADPPYGVTANKWDSVIPLKRHMNVLIPKVGEVNLYEDEAILELCKQGMEYEEAKGYFAKKAKEGMWERLNRVNADNAAIVMTASQPFTTTLIASNIQNFKYTWVWDKSQVTNFLKSKRQPLRRFEDVVVFYGSQPTYNPQMKTGKPYKISRTHETDNYGSQKSNETVNEGVRFPDGSIDVPQKRVKGGHPTQKPVALMEYLIKTYTNEGDTVLDFCMGSGTTGVAAVNLGRNFIGIEMNEDYYGVAEERIFEAQLKDFVGEGE